jgi:ubiquinone/menaquinone biosynthesis C-methylase UbiE
MSEAAILREFWNKPTLAEARDMILPAGTDWNERTEWVLPQILTETIRRRLPLAAHAVEIGCGIGRLMRAVKPRFRTVTGLDISESMVAFARQHLFDCPGAWPLLCDGYSFPLPPGSVEFVYSVIVFQHLPSREMVLRYLAEAFRILKPGGMIRVQTHMGEPHQGGFGGFHGWFYRDLDSFAAEFASCGFEILEADRRNEIYLWCSGLKT